MFSLKIGRGDWVFLAAAILKLFCNFLLITPFFNAFFRVFVVLEAFQRWGEKKREQQPAGRRTREICVPMDFGAQGGTVLELGVPCEGPFPGQRDGLCLSFSSGCSRCLGDSAIFLKVENGIKV